MDDEHKYALFIQYLGRGPQPTHYGADKNGEYFVIYDKAFVSVIAKAFGKHPEQVQQDVRNFVTVARRMGVLPEPENGWRRTFPGNMIDE